MNFSLGKWSLQPYATLTIYFYMGVFLYNMENGYSGNGGCLRLRW